MNVLFTNFVDFGVHKTATLATNRSYMSLWWHWNFELKSFWRSHSSKTMQIWILKCSSFIVAKVWIRLETGANRRWFSLWKRFRNCFIESKGESSLPNEIYSPSISSICNLFGQNFSLRRALSRRETAVWHWIRRDHKHLFTFVFLPFEVRSRCYKYFGYKYFSRCIRKILLAILPNNAISQFQIFYSKIILKKRKWAVCGLSFA